MVFFQSEECDLNGAINSLEKYRFSVARDGEKLVVGRGDSPQFQVSLIKEDFVQKEANEIAQGSEFANEMSKCNARFEVVIDDLDTALDEINTLMEVQGALQDASKGYLFTPWNDNVSEPWID
jgi:hypothetical protein